MPVWLTFLLALGLCVIVFTIATAIVGRLLRHSIEEVKLFNGPTLLRFQWKGTAYRLGCLPIGNSTKFGSEYDSSPIGRKLPVILSGCTALFLLSIVCVSLDPAWKALVSGFEQIVMGALHPREQGQEYIRGVLEFLESQPFVTILGYTAAKVCAMNLLPYPPLSGGYALVAILDWGFPRTKKYHFGVMATVGLILTLALGIGWIIAIASFVMAS
jgi:membrane-associated protease RseP (regulator of RpoE activity)